MYLNFHFFVAVDGTLNPGLSTNEDQLIINDLIRSKNKVEYTMKRYQISLQKLTAQRMQLAKMIKLLSMDSVTSLNEVPSHLTSGYKTKRMRGIQIPFHDILLKASYESKTKNTFKHSSVLHLSSKNLEIK